MVGLKEAGSGLESEATVHPSSSLQQLLGAALHAQGQLAEAESALRKSLELGAAEDTRRRAHEILGVMMMGRRRHREAENSFRRATTHLMQSHLNLGGALMAQRNFVEAEGVYAAALQCDDRPDKRPDAFLFRGRALQELGLKKEAVEAYREAVRLRPEAIDKVRQFMPGADVEATEQHTRTEDANAKNARGKKKARGRRGRKGQ